MRMGWGVALVVSLLFSLPAFAQEALVVTSGGGAASSLPPSTEWDRLRAGDFVRITGTRGAVERGTITAKHAADLQLVTPGLEVRTIRREDIREVERGVPDPPPGATHGRSGDEGSSTIERVRPPRRPMSVGAFIGAGVSDFIVANRAGVRLEGHASGWSGRVAAEYGREAIADFGRDLWIGEAAIVRQLGPRHSIALGYVIEQQTIHSERLRLPITRHGTGLTAAVTLAESVRPHSRNSIELRVEAGREFETMLLVFHVGTR